MQWSFAAQAAQRSALIQSLREQHDALMKAQGKHIDPQTDLERDKGLPLDVEAQINSAIRVVDGLYYDVVKLDKETGAPVGEILVEVSGDDGTIAIALARV